EVVLGDDGPGRAQWHAARVCDDRAEEDRVVAGVVRGAVGLEGHLGVRDAVAQALRLPDARVLDACLGRVRAVALAAHLGPGLRRAGLLALDVAGQPLERGVVAAPGADDGEGVVLRGLEPGVALRPVRAARSARVTPGGDRL